MSGGYIQIFTDLTAQQANQTLAYGDRLGENVRFTETNTQDFEMAARGAYAQANRSGVDAWSGNATTRGQILVQDQGQGLHTITNHHEGNGAYMLQQMTSMAMPTA